MEINDLLKGTNPKELKKLIAILQILADGSESSDNESENDDNEPETPIRTKSRKPVSDVKPNGKKNKPNKNKFLDMPEARMHKEDKDFTIKVAKELPVPRTREYDPIDVECRICHKKESVCPSLVDSLSRYKCNSCARNSG